MRTDTGLKMHQIKVKPRRSIERCEQLLDDAGLAEIDPSAVVYTGDNPIVPGGFGLAANQISNAHVKRVRKAGKNFDGRRGKPALHLADKTD